MFRIAHCLLVVIVSKFFSNVEGYKYGVYHKDFTSRLGSNREFDKIGGGFHLIGQPKYLETSTGRFPVKNKGNMYVSTITFNVPPSQRVKGCEVVDFQPSDPAGKLRQRVDKSQTLPGQVVPPG